jgi:hypothetical protein
MKRLTTAISLLCLGCSSGCIIVSPRAATVLTLRSSPNAPQSVSVGFRDTVWSLVDGNLVIVGMGWHPREHETYAYFICEPYPAFQPRWILLTPSETAGRYNFDLWCCQSPYVPWSSLQAAEFQGAMQNVKWRSGRKLKIDLSNLTLISPRTNVIATVSGRIMAKPETQACVKRMLQRRAQMMHDYALKGIGANAPNPQH